jgi:hypothetical protein
MAKQIVRTPRELIALLQTLPPEVPLELQPISMAWLGTSAPIRAGDVQMFTADGVDDADAETVASGQPCKAVLYLYEDKQDS